MYTSTTARSCLNKIDSDVAITLYYSIHQFSGRRVNYAYIIVRLVYRLVVGGKKKLLAVDDDEFALTLTAGQRAYMFSI